MGARLREVDPSGRFGLVTTWRMARRIIDLGRGDHHRVPMISGTGAEILSARADDILPWPCPLPSGGLVASVKLAGFEGLYIWSKAPSRGNSIRPKVVRADEWAVLPKRLCLSEDGSLAAVARDDEVVDVIDVEEGRRVLRVSESGHVVHAIALSVGVGMVALGAYGRVTLFRLCDGERIGAVRTSHGNLRWVGVGKGVVGTVTEHGMLQVTKINRLFPPRLWSKLDVPHSLGREVRGPSEASISRDGQLLAVPDERRNIVIVDVRSGRLQRLRAHTDRISLIRFVRDGAALITADYDNRVVIWPRRASEIVKIGRHAASI